MGTTVPTKIVGTANGVVLLAVPTNLSEQYTFYNAAIQTARVPVIVRVVLVVWLRQLQSGSVERKLCRAYVLVFLTRLESFLLSLIRCV